MLCSPFLFAFILFRSGEYESFCSRDLVFLSFKKKKQGLYKWFQASLFYSYLNIFTESLVNLLCAIDKEMLSEQSLDAAPSSIRTAAWFVRALRFSGGDYLRNYQ